MEDLPPFSIIKYNVNELNVPGGNAKGNKANCSHVISFIQVVGFIVKKYMQ